MARGIFSGTIVSSSPRTTEAINISGNADLSLTFQGTGSIKLQRFINDDWKDIPGGTFTKSTEDTIYSYIQRDFRLACTKLDGGSISWEIS